MNEHHFLAFDLGATSGRSILATLSSESFEMEEITRFPNAIYPLNGKFYWNIFSLFQELKRGLTECAKRKVKIDSIGIDTWGVDFGFVAPDGSLLGLPRAYRDPYTEGAPEAFFRTIPQKEVYERTGIQVMPFNTLFQLSRAGQGDYRPQQIADKMLFMPDLLSYMLTGNMVCEYTIASTSQMINPYDKKFEEKLIAAVGLNASKIPQLVNPGTKVGMLSDEICEETGMEKIPVIAVAGHDTASAVAAVPAQDKNFAYLSSGTWSLLGIETEKPIINDASEANNFTNEGGIEGTIRFLKNITGMWLLEQSRKVWKKEGKDYSYAQIDAMTQAASGFQSLVNPDDPRFANPVNMVEAIASYCKETHQAVPSNDAEYIRCIFCSLANRYKEVVKILRTMAPFPIEKLHVIGGGAKNALLNQMTADALEIPVIAGPSEATAIGNCMIQAKANGLVTDRWDMRRRIAQVVETTTYLPKK